MARCLLLSGGTDSSGAHPLVDAGSYTSGATCIGVALDSSEYQSWVGSTALLFGTDYTSMGVLLTAVVGIWSLAWVFSMVRR